MSPIETTEASPSQSSLIESRRALVDRVIQSAVFARSERLSSFLAYVCDVTLQGHGEEINEQRIGTGVFGRAPGYDSSVDGIVRTQASRLRQRLEMYFTGEGSTEPIRIVLPKGSYVPVFEELRVQPEPERAVDATSAVIVPVPGPPVAKATLFRILPWILCGALACLLVIVILARQLASSDHLPHHPAPHPLWSRLLPPGGTTLEVPADSGLVLYQGVTRRATRLDQYVLGSYRMAKPTAVTPQETLATDLANRRYTSVVDLEISTRVGQMALAGNTRLEIRFARDLRPNDLKTGNAILLGAAEANPWVELFERNMNFYFRDDLQTLVFTVFNRSPRDNEPARWDSALTDPQHHVYGVAAFLPNLGGSGNVLILEGTSMSGTEAAWDFISDDTQLLPFLEKISKADGTVPHFEVLVGTNNLNASALQNKILAWRTTD